MQLISSLKSPNHTKKINNFIIQKNCVRKSHKFFTNNYFIPSKLPCSKLRQKLHLASYQKKNLGKFSRLVFFSKIFTLTKFALTEKPSGATSPNSILSQNQLSKIFNGRNGEFFFRAIFARSRTICIELESRVSTYIICRVHGAAVVNPHFFRKNFD